MRQCQSKRRTFSMTTTLAAPAPLPIKSSLPLCGVVAPVELGARRACPMCHPALALGGQLAAPSLQLGAVEFSRRSNAPSSPRSWQACASARMRFLSSMVNDGTAVCHRRDRAPLACPADQRVVLACCCDLSVTRIVHLFPTRGGLSLAWHRGGTTRNLFFCDFDVSWCLRRHRIRSSKICFCCFDANFTQVTSEIIQKPSIFFFVQ